MALRFFSAALFVLVSGTTALASIEQCPDLKGRFFCPKVAGSHEDMAMTIRQVKYAGRITYYYYYEQRGEPAFELSFPASDQGVKNPDQDGMIGKCEAGSFFNSKDGVLGPKSLVNRIDPEDGAYIVVRNVDQSVFLRCKSLSGTRD